MYSLPYVSSKKCLALVIILSLLLIDKWIRILNFWSKRESWIIVFWLGYTLSQVWDLFFLKRRIVWDLFLLASFNYSNNFSQCSNSWTFKQVMILRRKLLALLMQMTLRQGTIQGKKKKHFDWFSLHTCTT